MTTLTSVPKAQQRSFAARTADLAVMELRLLVRNKVALFNALALGPLMVLATLSLIDGRVVDVEGGFTAGIVTSILVFALLFVVYYNLTTTAVARREELMLKRLLTGESTRWEVLVAMALPSFLVVLAQAVLSLIAAAFAFGMPPMTNVIWMIAALIGGTVIMATLGYASTAFTKTVEAAQLTTMPFLLGAILLSGLLFPTPEGPTAWLFDLSPAAPIVQLLQLGLTGVSADGQSVDFLGSFAAAGQPLLVMIAWVAIGIELTRRYLRWEPRR
ncbi:MAG: ABC transporter permease [Beutenbergiaceae bacterium]